MQGWEPCSTQNQSFSASDELRSAGQVRHLPLPGELVDVELLLVQGRIALHDYGPFGQFFHLG